MSGSRKAICDKDHGDLPLKLINLPQSQAGPLRHCCPGCAYLIGFEAGRQQGKLDLEALRQMDRELAEAAEAKAGAKIGPPREAVRFK